MTEQTQKVSTSTEVEASSSPASEQTDELQATTNVSVEDAEQEAAAPVESAELNTVDDEDEEDAAALMESYLQDFKRPTDYKVGDKVEGRVVSIDSSYVFLDIGSKSEASIPKDILLEGGDALPSVGDTLEAYVISVEGGGVELGKHLPGGNNSTAALEDAFHNQIPVEGSVTGRNKGGLEVQVFGMRAFCPISQIELRFCESLDPYLGKTFTFRIIELKNKGKNIVVSRRVLLEEENAEKAQKVREQLAEGAEFAGEVVSLTNYGAFVDIGAGVEGLVHVSEISHHRIQDPADVLKVGQQVRVLVQKYNTENGRISLSMKALDQDPWEAAVSEFAVDTQVTGKAVRLQPFGVFVELAPGVDGLVHISEISHRRINHPREVISVGDSVEVKVISIDLDKKRIGLSMKELDSSGAPPEIEGEIREGLILDVIVDKIEGFGIFVRLPQGKRGLLPNNELNAPKGADLARQYPPESTVKAIITRIDENGRIRLSQRAMNKKKEEEEYREYKQSAKKQKSGPVFGTLGDLLKNMKK